MILTTCLTKQSNFGKTILELYTKLGQIEVTKQFNRKSNIFKSVSKSRNEIIRKWMFRFDLIQLLIETNINRLSQIFQIDFTKNGCEGVGDGVLLC